MRKQASKHEEQTRGRKRRRGVKRRGIERKVRMGKEGKSRDS